MSAPWKRPWNGTVTSRKPPETSTRRTSDISVWVSATCSSTCTQVTTSKLASGAGSRPSSAGRAQFMSGWAARARSIAAGEGSTPVTSAPCRRQPCRQRPVTAPDVEQPALARAGVVQPRLERLQHMLVRRRDCTLVGQPSQISSWTARVAEISSWTARNAPLRLNTAGSVFSRIERSRKTLHRSRYRKSRRTSSSKSSSARPDTCHRPVMPGSTR